MFARTLVVFVSEVNKIPDETIKENDEIIAKTDVTLKANEKKLNDVKTTLKKYENQNDDISVVERLEPGCNELIKKFISLTNLVKFKAMITTSSFEREWNKKTKKKKVGVRKDGSHLSYED
ncbi:hypothetical protein J1N35_013194 [Gossypium stocksii]|uniref:Uncharacterized protein n=1 Tax=Gossypium stocksii TaxID=47602 RepID=A0A9D4A6G7_9ROSI|nr:hypothetical protein J1N35_013194 [Gossypium stocksii]